MRAPGFKAFVMLLALSAPSLGYAAWLYYPDQYQSPIFGAWDSYSATWTQFNLPPGDQVIQGGAVVPLDSSNPFPPLTGGMVVQAVNMGLNFDPYAADPMNPVNAGKIGAQFAFYGGTILMVSLLGYAVGFGFHGLLGLIRRAF